jgi:hypothetical protein
MQVSGQDLREPNIVHPHFSSGILSNKRINGTSFYRYKLSFTKKQRQGRNPAVSGEACWGNSESSAVVDFNFKKGRMFKGILVSFTRDRSGIEAVFRRLVPVAHKQVDKPS